MMANGSDTGTASDRVIQIRDLTFRWEPRSADVLSLPALDIDRGERLFIEGPSGSGKSTLLSLLSGICIPQQGTLEVLGQGLHTMRSVDRDHFRADHIGYVFQMFNLIPYLSVIENVMLSCRFSKLRTQRARQQSSGLEAEALRLLQKLDMGDDDILHRPVTSLSVGQQQRVAAARALMGSPEIIIADEPTSSLDQDRMQAFVELLFEECTQAGSTLVFVSHDTSLAPLFDRCLRLAEVNTAHEHGRQ